MARAQSAAVGPFCMEEGRWPRMVEKIRGIKPRCGRRRIGGSTPLGVLQQRVRPRSAKQPSSRRSAMPRRRWPRQEGGNMADRVTVKPVKKLPPVSTEMQEPSAKRDLVQAPDLVMQRKLKGQRLIGGRR